MNGEHEWYDHRGTVICRFCLVVRREDGHPHKPCRGPVTLSLRDDLPPVEVIPEPRPARRVVPVERAAPACCPACGRPL